jgi:UDP-glucose 4-epimerase
LNDEPSNLNILVTGIGGHFGRAVARRLHRHHSVLGIDRREVPGLPKDIEVYNLDIRRRGVEDVFRRHTFDAVVHLNIMHDPRTRQEVHHAFNIAGTQKIFDLCARHEIPKIVVLSSADVYGPHPSNNQLLTEDAPLMGGQNFGAIRDLIALDMHCNTFFWRHPEIETVILRPVHIVGRVDNAPSRYLRLERPLTILGFDPMVQVIHVEDVVTVIEESLHPGVRGVYNVTGPSAVPLSYLLKRLDRRPLRLPEPLARALLEAGWSLKITDWPVPEVDHIKYVCMVDDSRARRDMGFQHAHDLDAILKEVDAQPLL